MLAAIHSAGLVLKEHLTLTPTMSPSHLLIAACLQIITLLIACLGSAHLDVVKSATCTIPSNCCEDICHLHHHIGAGASELAVSTLQHLMRPLGPSNVWQAIHGKLFFSRLQRAPAVCWLFLLFSAIML